MKLRLAAAYSVALLGLVACDGPSANAPERAAAAAPDAASAAEAAPSPAAAPAAGSAATPAFAAVYPGAEVQASVPGADGPSGAGGLVTFTTEATPDAVVDFYKSRAEAAGLHPVMGMSQGDTRAYGAAEDGDGGANVSVIASPGEDATSVQLTWSEGQ